MPYLSAFTPLGLLHLNGNPSPANVIYDAIVSAEGGDGPNAPFDFTEGTHVQAIAYAQAMGLARSAEIVRHAGDQDLPTRALEHLADQERAYGLVPLPSATVAERRAAYAAAKLLPTGNTITAMQVALEALLGDDFVAYRPTPHSEAEVWPAALGDQPMNLVAPNVPRKMIKLAAAISVGLGAPQTVRYLGVKDDAPEGVEWAQEQHYLEPGDIVVLDPGSSGQVERVEVTAVSYDFDDFEAGPFYGTFTATFNKPHGVDAIGTTMPFPAWSSTKRHHLIVIKDSANTRDNRRQIDNLLRKKLRAVATWDIVSESVAGQSGPFKVGEGKLGMTTIGTVTL